MNRIISELYGIIKEFNTKSKEIFPVDESEYLKEKIERSINENFKE